jgi:hypothetical protein
MESGKKLIFLRRKSLMKLEKNPIKIFGRNFLNLSTLSDKIKLMIIFLKATYLMKKYS